MTLYHLSNDMIELIKLYTFIEKLNKPLTAYFKDNDDINYFYLVNKDDFHLFIEKENNHFYLKLDSVLKGDSFSFKVKLGKAGYFINKRVVNDVRSHLCKVLKNNSINKYRESLYSTMEADLYSIVRRTILNEHQFGFSKTQTTCVDLTLPFGIVIDIEINLVCRFKIIRTGFIMTVKRRVYDLHIDEYTFNLSEGEDITTKYFLKELRKRKGLF